MSTSKDDMAWVDDAIPASYDPTSDAMTCPAEVMDHTTTVSHASTHDTTMNRVNSTLE